MSASDFWFPLLGIPLAVIGAAPAWVPIFLGPRFGRWEAWAVYTRHDERVGERFLTRRFTRRGALRYAESVTNTPQVLAKTLETMVFVDAEVRERGAAVSAAKEPE